MAERATDQSRSSTPLDIELGRRTELDYFNGLVQSKGRELGIPTPVNDAVMRVVKLLERRELKPDVANLALIDKSLDYVSSEE
jgi:ketopantoate reductase